MLKAIRLTYRKNKNITGRIISMFFRLAGIYVTDRYIYKNGYIDENLEKRIEELLEENTEDIKRINPIEFQYDAELFFIADEHDNFILNDELVKDVRNKIFISSHQLDRQMYSGSNHICDNTDNMGCIEIVLKKLNELQIITEPEYKDLDLLRRLYIENNYFNTLMKSKYFFNAEPLYKKNCTQYNGNINQAIHELTKVKLKEWGEERYRHTQYAVAEMTYELNLYCQRNLKGMVYSVDGLIEVIEALDKKNSEDFGNHTKCLLGQVYYDLKDEGNNAYEYYLECCNDNESLYNAYLFKIKGIYWQNFVGDYERANKYYLKSILIFPEYFSAWYKMGFCYYQLNNKKMALHCFETVVEILQNTENTMLAPKDIEHLFLSLKQCAELIYEINADIEKSIEYALKAIELWMKISNNEYLKMIGSGEEETKILREEVKKNLDIKKVAVYTSKMYKMNNQYEKAQQIEENFGI